MAISVAEAREFIAKARAHTPGSRASLGRDPNDRSKADSIIFWGGIAPDDAFFQSWRASHADAPVRVDITYCRSLTAELFRALSRRAMPCGAPVIAVWQFTEEGQASRGIVGEGMHYWIDWTRAEGAIVIRRPGAISNPLNAGSTYEILGTLPPNYDPSDYPHPFDFLAPYADDPTCEIVTAYLTSGDDPLSALLDCCRKNDAAAIDQAAADLRKKRYAISAAPPSAEWALPTNSTSRRLLTACASSCDGIYAVGVYANLLNAQIIENTRARPHSA